LVPLCSFFWEAGPGEQRWNDLLDCNALHHALPRIHFHSRRRMEDDQTNGAVNVLLLLSFCASIPCFDIWLGGVPNELEQIDGAVNVLLLLSFCDSIPCFDIWVGGVPNEYLSAEKNFDKNGRNLHLRQNQQ